MAAPQFFVPQRPSRSKSVRRFTLEQANATLPLVRKIVADIVKTHAKAAQLRQQIEKLDSGKEMTAAQKELDRTIEQLQDFANELAAVGAELKDVQIGLIDFIGRHEGRDVCLCWKLGEDAIAFWHEMDAGVAGRKPIASLHEK